MDAVNGKGHVKPAGRPAQGFVYRAPACAMHSRQCYLEKPLGCRATFLRFDRPPLPDIVFPAFAAFPHPLHMSNLNFVALYLQYAVVYLSIQLLI
jgi:hypothetical protein